MNTTTVTPEPTDPWVASCCGSPDLLQDAYVDPNAYPAEVVSTFDNFVCDNDECDAYGSECSSMRLSQWKATANA